MPRGRSDLAEANSVEVEVVAGGAAAGLPDDEVEAAAGEGGVAGERELLPEAGEGEAFLGRFDDAGAGRVPLADGAAEGLAGRLGAGAQGEGEDVAGGDGAGAGAGGGVEA